MYIPRQRGREEELYKEARQPNKRQGGKLERWEGQAGGLSEVGRGWVLMWD